MDIDRNEPVYVPRRIPIKESYWINDLTDTKQRQRQVQPRRKLYSRKMLDSYMEEFLPFKSDPKVLEEYIDPHGGIRIGKVFEDLDLLAANIGYRHCAISESHLMLATASIDRIDLIKPIPISDIRISGHVTYAGHSSTEVMIKMEALEDGIYPNIQTSSGATEITKHDIPLGDSLIIARFIMVAIDPFSGRTMKVNPLQLENENEYQKKLFQIVEDQKARKSASAAAALTKLPPTEDEKLLIHDLYLKNSKYANQKGMLPQNLVWMDETVMESFTYMQPQNRNIYKTIFGGYLLRLAYELAMSNASVFFKCQATFLSLDEVSFKRPVPVGSILGMHSQIVYAPGSPCKSIQVAVTADVLDIKKEKRETADVFYFTFKCDNPAISVRGVVPKTYIESMKYAEGRRRHQISLKETATNDKIVKIISKL